MVYGNTGEDYKRQQRSIPSQEWRYPNSGTEPVIRSDRLYQAFPQDNAVLTKGMVVTLGLAAEPGENPYRQALRNLYCQRYRVPATNQGGRGPPRQAHRDSLYPPGAGKIFLADLGLLYQ